jgi:hypothetical protein
MKLVCRSCQRERARAGMLLHQRRFLQTWIAGNIELRLRYQDGTLHIELFDDRWHAYCGADMYVVTPRERRLDLPPEVCPACRATLEKLAAQASREGR